MVSHDVKRVWFDVPVGKRYLLPSGRMVNRRMVCLVSDEHLRQVTVRYEEVEDDGSKMGSWLEKTFARVQIVPAHCSGCDLLKDFLDNVSVQWLGRHKAEITAAIRRNAQQLGHPVTGWVINGILTMAMKSHRQMEGRA